MAKLRGGFQHTCQRQKVSRTVTVNRQKGEEEEEEEERLHTVRSSKYCAGARDTEQKEVRIKMTYSNLQVGIVTAGDFTG